MTDSSNPPPSVQEISTLYSYDTEYSADSVEWCPQEPFLDVFVCANYQLKKGENGQDNVCERVGRLLLFKITPDSGLNLLQTIDTAAVLDQKWCHCKINGDAILGVVHAKKSIEIYKLNPEMLLLELVTYYELDSEGETLILSLDWSTGKYGSDTPEIVCSDSRGNIHRFHFENGKLSLEQSWHGHDFEAWIAGFYYWDVNITFSGGDDCKLFKYDKRVGSEPISTNRSHDAGVTALHSNPAREHVIATGSYDENVRLWDIRHMKHPTNSHRMPGTIWRVKWDPFCYNYLLTACMLGGIHIINATLTENLQIFRSYYGHKDISYGADWCHLKQEHVEKFEHSGNVIIGTCSFYDHLLCVSKVTLSY